MQNCLQELVEKSGVRQSWPGGLEHHRPQIDGLRFVAMVSVFYEHFGWSGRSLS